MTATMSAQSATIDGPRACQSHELAPTLDVGTAVMRLEQDRPPTWGHSWPHIYCAENLENVRIIKVGHQVVSSMAIFHTDVLARTGQGKTIMLRVGGINGVATLPEFRRHGFAGQLLLDCHAKMRADGCDIGLLVTGIHNWYRRFGWENGAQRWTFTVDRGSSCYLPVLDPALHVAEVTNAPSALAEIAILHRQAELGAQRRSELDGLLLTRLGNRVFGAWHHDKLVAYAVVRNHAVEEYGGPAATVAGLIRTIFEEADDSAASTSGQKNNFPWTLWMQIHTPPVDTGLGLLLGNLGLPCKQDYLGMICIMNPQQLMDKIAPRIRVEESAGAEEACGAGERGLKKEDTAQLILRTGHIQHYISRRQLVKLLFGPERPLTPFQDLQPLTFYQWPLDEV